MAMDETVMLEVLKAITRVETKVDMMMQEDAAEDTAEEGGGESPFPFDEILGTSYIGGILP